MEKRADKKARENAEAQLLKELKNCVSEGQFKEALDIIGRIDVSKIKVAPNLCLIGEVYMHEEMYEAAENVFVRAYDKTPSNRRILSLLTNLYIEMGDYGEAEYYYKEFIGVASRDLHRYILRYRLDKAKGERTAVLIDTLERLKDYEYIEEWAYELAELYHKSGDDKKAVHECDEIVLWFGHGPYVNKAVRLKCEITGEAIPVFDEDFMSAYDANQSGEHVPTGLTDSSIDINLIEQALKAQEEQKQQLWEKQEKYISSENVMQPDGAEKNMVSSAVTQDSESSDAPEQEIADSFFDNFENSGGYAEETLDDEDKTPDSADMVKDIDAAGTAGIVEEKTASLFDALSADSTMDFWGAKKKKSRRFFKKRSVEEIEQEQRAAELEKKRRQEEEIQKRYIDAVENTSDMDEFDDEDDFEDEIITDNDFSDDLLSEDDFEDEVIDEEHFESSFGGEDAFAEALFDADDFDSEDDNVILSRDSQTPSMPMTKENDDFSSGSGAVIDNCLKESADEEMVVEDFDEDIDEDIDENISGNAGADGLMMDEDDMVEERVWTEEDKTFINGLFDESKTSSNLFATVPNIDYVKEQLSMTFTKFEDSVTDKVDILAAYDINFVVLADDKSVKSQIALGIAKALNTYGICDKEKIVRAKARDLNQRDFSKIFDKLKGGCLIIEKADLLSDDAAKIIEDYVNKDNQQTAIVFASIHDEMMKFWKKHQTLRSKFLNVINVAKYNEMELVTLAKGYIEQRKYEMDPEAALVLRDYFRKCLDNNQVINYEDVMGIVDMAISNLENRNVKNLFMTVLDNKYEEAKMFKLIADDFKMLTKL